MAWLRSCSCSTTAGTANPARQSAAATTALLEFGTAKNLRTAGVDRRAWAEDARDYAVRNVCPMATSLSCMTKGSCALSKASSGETNSRFTRLIRWVSIVIMPRFAPV